MPSQVKRINLLMSAHFKRLRMLTYSLFQKKRTFNSNFFRGPPGEGGTKIHMVNYVNVELPFT